ncbi:hypothetical protein TWF481_003970 [Arthrobotrys musiformis]|uniref:Uncharacterized protein n=1 Tax=Arthrobotrys musiformis TaxID=47236 RepID=A0AAV9WIL9_9PEZI
MPPKRRQTAPANEPSATTSNPTTSRRRGNQAVQEQELPSRRSQRSRGTVAAAEAVSSDVPEQTTAPVTRARRGRAAATANATTQQSEPVVEDVQPPTKTKARAKRSTKAKAEEKAAEEDSQAVVEETRPLAEQPKRQTRKKKVPVAPSTKASRSRSNSVTSVQSLENEAGEEGANEGTEEQPSVESQEKQTRKKKAPVPPSARASRSRSNSVTSLQSLEPEGEQEAEEPQGDAVVPAPEKQGARKIMAAKGSRKKTKAEGAAEIPAEASVAEYSGPTRFTRSKAPLTKGKENDRPTRASKRGTEPTADVASDEPRTKRQKVEGDQEAGQAPKRRRGRVPRARPAVATELPAPVAPTTPPPQEPVATEEPKAPTPLPASPSPPAIQAAITTPIAEDLQLPGVTGTPEQDDEASQQLFQEQGCYADEDPVEDTIKAEALAEAGTDMVKEEEWDMVEGKKEEEEEWDIVEGKKEEEEEAAEEKEEKEVVVEEEVVVVEEEEAAVEEEEAAVEEVEEVVEEEEEDEAPLQYARACRQGVYACDGDEDLSLTDSDIQRLGPGEGVQFRQEGDTALSLTESDVERLGGGEDVEMADVGEEGEEGEEAPEEGDAAGDAWPGSANPSALAPLSQAAINAGHTAQDGAGPEEAGSAAEPTVPQTPTRPAWGQWGHLRHQPRLSSPLKSYCMTAQYSPPKEVTPVRGRRISENGILSLSGDPSPLRSEELLARDFNTPVGTPSQASPRMRPTPGPRRRGRSRSVCGSSPLKNAVDFALDTSNELEPKIASPLARLVSDYDPTQEISELRIEEVSMTPNAPEPVGNILDEVVEEQQLLEECAIISSDDSNDEVAAIPTPGLSQGFDGADSPPEKPKRRSRLPVPKAIENLPSSPASARMKRVTQTKNLSDRELLKVTARNTTRNAVYKNAKFERKVVRITRQRPPSPTRDTQTAAAEEARLLRQRVFEETGVALGPGDDSDYVPPQVSPSAKKVKWHERLEHDLDDEEKAGFSTDKGILAPERVRRDSGTVHEITIQKILYEGEKDVLDEDFDEGF